MKILVKYTVLVNNTILCYLEVVLVIGLDTREIYDSLHAHHLRILVLLRLTMQVNLFI